MRLLLQETNRTRPAWNDGIMIQNVMRTKVIVRLDLPHIDGITNTFRLAIFPYLTACVGLLHVGCLQSKFSKDHFCSRRVRSRPFMVMITAHHDWQENKRHWSPTTSPQRNIHQFEKAKGVGLGVSLPCLSHNAVCADLSRITMLRRHHRQSITRSILPLCVLLTTSCFRTASSFSTPCRPSRLHVERITPFRYQQHERRTPTSLLPILTAATQNEQELNDTATPKPVAEEDGATFKSGGMEPAKATNNNKESPMDPTYRTLTKFTATTALIWLSESLLR